jgi:hypothetical protein
MDQARGGVIAPERLQSILWWMAFGSPAPWGTDFDLSPTASISEMIAGGRSNTLDALDRVTLGLRR